MVTLWQSTQSIHENLLDARFMELGLKRTHAATHDDWYWVLVLGGYGEADSVGYQPEP